MYQEHHIVMALKAVAIVVGTGMLWMILKQAGSQIAALWRRDRGR